jgi:hypothetical protein
LGGIGRSLRVLVMANTALFLSLPGAATQSPCLESALLASGQRNKRGFFKADLKLP